MKTHPKTTGRRTLATLAILSTLAIVTGMLSPPLLAEEPAKGPMEAPVTQPAPAPVVKPADASPKKLEMSSPAFIQGSPIPPEYTCDGADRSPPFYWQGVSKTTKTLALIAEDPDAPSGTWVHWVMYNIPTKMDGVAAGTIPMPQLGNGAIQGGNDFHRFGYGGPCPPPGKLHHYFFRLYALDVEFPFAMGMTKDQLLRAMEGHVLDKTELMGVYQRK